MHKKGTCSFFAWSSGRKKKTCLPLCNPWELWHWRWLTFLLTRTSGASLMRSTWLFACLRFFSVMLYCKLSLDNIFIWISFRICIFYIQLHMLWIQNYFEIKSSLFLTIQCVSPNASQTFSAETTNRTEKRWMLC